MSEEKRLNDETLENVSGGSQGPDNDPFHSFLASNCARCRLAWDCPYGGSDKAFSQLGAGAKCLKMEAW